MRNTNKFQHPIQPIFQDDFGTFKFKSNDIVANYMELPILKIAEAEELHTLTEIGFTAEDIMQLAQLLAYTPEKYEKLANKLGVPAITHVQHNSRDGLTSSGSARPDNTNVPKVTHIDPRDSNYRMVAVIVKTHFDDVPYIPVLVRCPRGYDWPGESDHMDAAEQYVNDNTDCNCDSHHDESQQSGLVLARGLNWRSAHVIDLEDWLEAQDQ